VPCLLALITTACGGIGNPTTPLAAPTPSASAPPSTAEPTPWMPIPEKIGEQARLAVTFPDSSEAVFAYPAHLNLATMGVQPDVDLLWGERWVGAIVFSHGGAIGRLLEGAEPVALHTLDGQTIEEWLARPRRGRHQETARWLVFSLRTWTVHVPLNAQMDPADVIGRVRPYQTDRGFVAIEVAQPADLPEVYGVAGGPQLAFGDRDPLPDFVLPGQDGLLINVAPSKCGAYQPSTQVLGSSTHGSVCLEGELFVNGTSFSDTEQTRRKLAEVVEGLRLLELEPAA
jgi:hypothetical protein